MKTINVEDRFKDDLTEQEIFDFVAHHLGTMKERCVDDRGRCVYRGPDNNSCAAGYLLTDGEAANVCNCDGFVPLCMNGKIPHRLVRHQSMISSLQCIHDSSGDWEDRRRGMLASLKDMAMYRNLDDSILSNPDYAWNRPHIEQVLSVI